MVGLREKLYYAPIGFVSNDEQATTFAEKEAPMLIRAKEQIDKQGLPIGLGLKTTLLAKGFGKPIHPQLYADVKNAFGRLLARGIDVSVDSWASGPTRTMFSTIFDPGITSCASPDGSEQFTGIATGDLDQFPVDRNLEHVLGLWEMAKDKECIMGVGSRSVPIRLSEHPANAAYRRIFENFVNYAIRDVAASNSNKLFLPADYEIPGDPAYTDSGDFVTGVYVANHVHPDFNRFVGDVTQNARDNRFFLFEDEYSMMKMVASRGDLCAKVVHSIENPFEVSGDSVKEEKQAIFKKQIRAPLEKIKTLPEAQHLRDVLTDKRGVLYDHYDNAVVDEVADYMLDCLKV